LLGVQHVPLVVRYLDGIDEALSRTFMRPGPPDEPALTSQLCALLDAESQRREKLLRFNIDHLNRALSACGEDLHFDFRIDAHPHSAKMENLVSQSDLGLVLNYENFILPEVSRRWSYLLQAKKLHPFNGYSIFDDRSSFRSINHAQHLRLLNIAKKFGEEHFRYMMYCPQVSAFAQPTATKIRALHTFNLSSRIYDYTSGLTLFDYLKRVSGRVDSGIWLAPVESLATKILDAHSRAFEDVWPFAWFLVRHFISPSPTGDQRRHHQAPPSTSSVPPKTNDDLIYGVVTGDRHAIESFASAFQAHSGDLPSLTILPKSTITITASIGRSLPEDARKVITRG
jgi:hypothetical protein